jgi:hypothetical protein
LLVGGDREAKVISWLDRRELSRYPARMPLSRFRACPQQPAAGVRPPAGVERPRRMVRFARLIQRRGPFWRTFGPRRLRRRSDSEFYQNRKYQQNGTTGLDRAKRYDHASTEVTACAIVAARGGVTGSGKLPMPIILELFVPRARTWAVAPFQLQPSPRSSTLSWHFQRVVDRASSFRREDCRVR